MRRWEYVQGVNQALREEMARDDSVFILGEDVTYLGSPFKTCDNLFREFPGRVLNSPISEIGIAGLALGAAITGMRPIVEFGFSDFMMCAMDQICNQIAKAKYMFGGKAVLPIVMKTQQGGYVQNAAQHSASVESWFCHTAGLKIIMPSCAADAYGLMKSAVRDDNPVVFFDHKAMYNDKSDVPDGEFLIPIGVADVKRPGKDVTIIATSYQVHHSFEAAEILAKEGIDAEIVDPRTLVPLDKETILESVAKTGRAVIVHEACRTCGWGAEMAAVLADEGFDSLTAPIQRVTGLDCPIPYSRTLEPAMLPSVEGIVAACKKVCEY